jgi:hypothetical protein
MPTSRREVFISHDSVEAPIADLFRQALHHAGYGAFVAGRDIVDAPWEETIAKALARATHGMVLVSARSMQSRWVWMELAAIRFRLGRVIPVLLPGLNRDELPDEIRRFQVRSIATPADVDTTLRLIDEDHSIDYQTLHRNLISAVDWRAVRPGPPLDAPRGHGILVDASHNQKSWPLSWAKGWSLFDRVDDAVDAIVGEPLDIRLIEDRKQLYRGHLSDWSGLVVTTPRHAVISGEIVDEIAHWVRAGGRLLLCGYEYGDLHHRANFNALAGRFGIRFRTDIVHPHLEKPPPAGSTLTKPYKEEIEIPRLADDALLEGIDHITLVNVQSIDVEPGGTPLLSTSGLPVCQPHPDDVVYEDEVFTTPLNRSVTIGVAAWLSVMVRAPRPLCGQGEVVAIGTWMLRPRVGVNDRFIRSLARWLTGR